MNQLPLRIYIIRVRKIRKIIFIIKPHSGCGKFPNIIIEVSQLFENLPHIIQHCQNHLWADLPKDWREGALPASSFS
jgi:hypothetical protein